MTFMIDFEQITHTVFDFIRGRLQFNPLNVNPKKMAKHTQTIVLIF